MSGRLKETFDALAQRRERALIAYLMAGDPDLATSGELALGALRAGADIVELGFPFSDPIADGPTLQRAAQRSLKNGTTLGQVLQLAGDLRTQTPAPLVLMGYLNPVMAYGEEKFFAECARRGVDGLILPDLPLDEAQKWRSLSVTFGIDLIFLVTPTSSEARAAALCDATSGFLYCVSATGVTGQRQQLPEDLLPRLARLREQSKVPVAVGFGVSSPEQAAGLAPNVDGVVVGSLLAATVEQSTSKEEALRLLSAEVSALKKALKEVGG